MKLKKMIVFIVGIFLIGFCLMLYFGFEGNPVSYFIVNHVSKDYVEEKYPGYHVENSTYSFKDGYYYVVVSLENSKDIYFSIIYDGLGKMLTDNYESSKEGNWNTFRRLDEEYRKRVDEVLMADDFSLKQDNIQYGSIVSINDTGWSFDFGINEQELIVDKEYDLKDIGKQGGAIIFYYEDEDISIENISYHILTLKEYLDENDVSFYALNFVLEDPTNIDNNVYVMIRSSDIYVENFESRLIKSIKETEEFYKEEDNLKTDELGIN